ncbi:hypothetical protein [Nonomuraea jiangxiensis]|uniref:Heparin binding hemagglutinin HbhA n=1 Tax=Nonomuraea jiangxiensis TaxID=633440 RepID=A0A1G8L9T1_9ACTN|nr:hypothetical protein [Nonomuraea jiangxiensis]SDI51960.1 hypothetical protein SAMN05421869_10626 [Nonomuraea jiangxiensis]
MTLATEVKKLAESKPFYAVAGMGDFAVEKLRELPERLHKLQTRRSELAKDLPERARAYADKAEGLARDFPVKARDYADQLTHRATEVYEDFATRGRKVVSKASGEAALELEEVSEAAEPPVAQPIKKTRTTNRTTKAKA